MLNSVRPLGSGRFSLDTQRLPSSFDSAAHVVRRLRERGHQAYVVGGAVRDLLLGQEVKDVDVASSASPDEVEACFSGTVPVGKAFGVIVVVLKYGDECRTVEVATFRKDDFYVDGRHPHSVEFSNIDQDAGRRDFTVNALYLDPAERMVIDLVGGVPDLARGLIRTVGNPELRFGEDKLRVLRAIRFASRLGFRIHPATLAAIRERHGNLDGVSVERVYAELRGMLTGPNPWRAFRLLEATGLLATVLPELVQQTSIESGGSQHRNLLARTFAGLRSRTSAEEALGWSLLLRNVTATRPEPEHIVLRLPDRTETRLRILRRLKAPNDVVDSVTGAFRLIPTIMNFNRLRLAEQKRAILDPHMGLAFCVLESVASLAPSHIKPILASAGLMFSQHTAQPFSRLSSLLSGHDLMAAGFSPGPVLGRALYELENEWFENRIKSKEEAIDYALKNLLITQK